MFAPAMNEVWILSACRTPIGGFMGGLQSFSAPDLGAMAIEEALSRAKVDQKDVSEVFMGCVLTSGLGQAPARQAALKASLPNTVPCTTVGKVCGSGLKAVMLGAQAIALGDAQVVVAGGMESMSNSPYLLPKARSGMRLGHSEVIDSMVKDGLWDVYNDFHMGNAAELCAKECNVSREAQDDFAQESYRRAQKAQSEGLFKDEIVAVEVKGRKGDVTLVDQDEDVTRVDFEKMRTLRPVFDKNGTVTAANASAINDGAAALVLASAEWARSKGLKPIAKILGQAQAAREPEWFTLAPVDAINNLLKKLNWSVEDADLYEINEAFSVVSLAVNDRLKLKADRVNVNGGAVALGHPIGASGARVLTTLLYALKQRNKKTGIASLCLGGGEAVALAVERMES